MWSTKVSHKMVNSKLWYFISHSNRANITVALLLFRNYFARYQITFSESWIMIGPKIYFRKILDSDWSKKYFRIFCILIGPKNYFRKYCIVIGPKIISGNSGFWLVHKIISGNYGFWLVHKIISANSRFWLVQKIFLENSRWRNGPWRKHFICTNSVLWFSRIFLISDQSTNLAKSRDPAGCK